MPAERRAAGERRGAPRRKSDKKVTTGSKLDLILDVTRRLMSITDLDALLRDMAQATTQLLDADRATIFRSLRPDQAGDVLSELDDATLLELVRSLDDVEVSLILDRMPPEHAADVVDELSTEHAEKILDLMEDEKSEEIQEILEYPEDSAGRLMSADVVAGTHGTFTFRSMVESPRRARPRIRLARLSPHGVWRSSRRAAE